jgi:hypothetical protein
MMTVNAHDAYSRALMSDEPDMALRTVAAEMLRGGATRDELLEEFEELRVEPREQHRASDEDVVLDVMDYVEGFSSPQVRH